MIVNTLKRTLPTNTFFTQTPSRNDEHLCRFQVLYRLDLSGLEDQPKRDQRTNFVDFKEELTRGNERRYETEPLWKEGQHKKSLKLARW